MFHKKFWGRLRWCIARCQLLCKQIGRCDPVDALRFDMDGFNNGAVGKNRPTLRDGFYCRPLAGLRVRYKFIYKYGNSDMIILLTCVQVIHAYKGN